MADYPTRVKIWNCYLHATKEYLLAAKSHAPLNPSTGVGSAGGMLSPGRYNCMMATLHLGLAIEARANHHLHELEENRVILKRERDALLRLNFEQKWQVLPRVAGKTKAIDLDKPPHQAISQVHSHRTRLVHVAFTDQRFEHKIPGYGSVASMYNNFLLAMFDMNRMLGRSTPNEQRVFKVLSVPP